MSADYIIERVIVECDLRGLPHSIDALLRHIENNHAATLAFKDLNIETLQRRRDSYQTAIERAIEQLEKYDAKGPKQIVRARLTLTTALNAPPAA